MYSYTVCIWKFPVGDKVAIDGRREWAVLRHMGSTEGDIYTVRIHGINFEVNLPADRLSIVRDNEPKQTSPVWAHVCMHCVQNTGTESVTAQYMYANSMLKYF